MRTHAIIGMAALAFATAESTKEVGQRAGEAVAAATLVDQDGEVVGEATLRETPVGVLIDATFTRALAGTRAFHIHEKGVCQPPFASAGGHFSPGRLAHGYLGRNGPHAGDLPNIHVPAAATLRIEVMAHGLTLRRGDTAIIDADGAALVVHEKPDDYRTDPAGAAGTRIACGVIR